MTATLTESTDRRPPGKKRGGANRSPNGSPRPKQTSQTSGIAQLVTAVALALGVLWVFWPDLLAIQSKWNSDPHYSHGYLVPLFALLLLITRRQGFAPAQWSPSWWGCLLLAGAFGLKLYSSYYYIESLSHLSLIAALSAIPAVVWGKKGFRWALPGLAFLVFMVPLPHRLETAMQEPLRTAGTKAGTFFLQSVGLPAFSEGHVIVVENQSIGVAEACSGLNMLIVFFALSTAVAWIMTDSYLFRLVLILSAVPVAIAANILRIAVTAVVVVYFSHATVFGMTGEEFAHRFFHDWAGWFMMPLGLLMLWFEIWFLEQLVIRVPNRPVSALATHNLDTASTGDAGVRG